MADNEKGEESTPHGNEQELSKTMGNQEGEEGHPRGTEWEVVSLTASAYAAAPGPRGDESIHEEKGATVTHNDEAETSQALFMSGHFVFPPSQHENLPIEPESEQIPEGDADKEDFAEISSQAEHKEQENWNIEGLNVAEDFPGIQLVDEKGNKMVPIHGSDFDEAATLPGLNVDDKEQIIYGAADVSSLHRQIDSEGSAVCADSAIANNPEDSSDMGDLSSVLQSPQAGKGEEHDDSTLPCGAWWKRRVASLCAQAKETNAFWSVFVAAALMGIVLIGQRWQQERWQILQQRWQLSLGDEKSGRLLSRLKDVIVGGSRRGAYINSAPTER